MSEKQYLLLLRQQLQNKREVCGYNQNSNGQTLVTTASPRKYNENKISYVSQKTMSENDYISKKLTFGNRK